MPASSEERVPVGYVRRAHGIAGAVLVKVLTDDPELRYVPGARFMTDQDQPRRLETIAVRPHRDGLLVSFEGVGDRSEAEALRGVTLTIGRSERRDLGEDEYWEDELTGLGAVDAAGNDLGTVVGVSGGPTQYRLVIETASGGVAEVPFVEAIVSEVAPGSGRIVIDAPEGLI